MDDIDDGMPLPRPRIRPRRNSDSDGPPHLRQDRISLRILQHRGDLVKEHRAFKAVLDRKQKLIDVAEEDLQRRRKELEKEGLKLKELERRIARMDDGLAGAQALEDALAEVNEKDLELAENKATRDRRVKFSKGEGTEMNGRDGARGSAAANGVGHGGSEGTSKKGGAYQVQLPRTNPSRSRARAPEQPPDIPPVSPPRRSTAKSSNKSAGRA